MSGSSVPGPAYLFPTFTMREAVDAAPFGGLAAAIAELLAEARQHVDLPDSAFGPVTRTAPPGPEATLHAQYATLVDSVACARWAERHLAPPAAVTSFSMGLFGALVHAGSLGVGDAITLMQRIQSRANAIGEARPSALGIFIGCDRVHVREAIPAGSSVEVTVAYGRVVTITCGAVADVAALVERLAPGLHEARLFPVAAPFHTSMLIPLQNELDDLVQGFRITPPRHPVLSSSSVRWLVSEADVRHELATNIVKPIRWTDTIDELLARGHRRFVECGFTRELGDLLQRDHPGHVDVHQFVASRVGAS